MVSTPSNHRKKLKKQHYFIIIIFIVSSTLVEIEGFGSFLFDTGEGTFGQLYRRFGLARLEQVISQELKLIFISHLHADHHMGLIQILVWRDRWRKTQTNGLQRVRSLTIVGPRMLGLWLEEYAHCESLGDFKFVDCETLITHTESPGSGEGTTGIEKALLPDLYAPFPKQF